SLEKATKNLLVSMYPTIANVRFYFTEIQDHPKYCIENDDFNQYMLANSINQKINEYWKILDDVTTVATILDSQNKTTLFESGELTTKTINTLRDQLSLYLNQRPQLQTSLPKSSSSSREYFCQLKKRHLGTTAETT
ncbi:4094_t:CDS:1, partial [Funneliformis geosporum]